jgi:hypothetical protein
MWPTPDRGGSQAVTTAVHVQVCLGTGPAISHATHPPGAGTSAAAAASTSTGAGTSAAAAASTGAGTSAAAAASTGAGGPAAAVDSARQGGNAPADGADDGDNVCCICLDEMERVTVTRCGHLFCTPCIQQAVEVTARCPTCRTGLALQDLHGACTDEEARAERQEIHRQGVEQQYGAKVLAPGLALCLVSGGACERSIVCWCVGTFFRQCMCRCAARQSMCQTAAARVDQAVQGFG